MTEVVAALIWNKDEFMKMLDSNDEKLIKIVKEKLEGGGEK